MKTHDPSRPLKDQSCNKRKLKYEKTGYALISSGAIALMASFFLSNSTLTLVGLGLTLWGALLLFIRTNKYVRRELLDSTVVSSLMIINKILTEMKYTGKGIHLPPRYLKKPKELAVFVPTMEDNFMPDIKDIVPGKVFINPHGMCINPPGQGLLCLYEKEMGTDFSKTNLERLEDNLAKILIEDLEILENIELTVLDDNVHVKMTGLSIVDFCSQIRSTDICISTGCPFCSSIACALAKITDKAVVIERTVLSPDNKIVDVWYRLIDETNKETVK